VGKADFFDFTKDSLENEYVRSFFLQVNFELNRLLQALSQRQLGFDNCGWNHDLVNLWYLLRLHLSEGADIHVEHDVSLSLHF